MLGQRQIFFCLLILDDKAFVNVSDRIFQCLLFLVLVDAFQISKLFICRNAQSIALLRLAIGILPPKQAQGCLVVIVAACHLLRLSTAFATTSSF